MTTHLQDAQIQKDILAELKWNPQVEETDIGVIVKGGAVTLTGNVPNYAQKVAAFEAAKRIKDVRAVADKMEVKLAFETEGSDKDIAERIARSFEWNTLIPDSVKAEVRNGFVTLSGEADWQYQRNAAYSQVATIKGIRFITNNITVRKRLSAANIKDEIVKALHRRAKLEASRIRVAAADGAVTIAGTVDSYFEKNLVKNAVWSAPGVVSVIDDLTVAPSYSAAA